MAGRRRGPERSASTQEAIVKKKYRCLSCCLVDGLSVSACEAQPGAYPTACTLCAGMGWDLTVRDQRSCGEELALMGHMLIFRKPNIINLLLRKWEHLICRSQVFLAYISGTGFYL